MKTMEALAQNLSAPAAQIQQWLDQVRADPAYPKDDGLELGGLWSNMQQQTVQAAMVQAGIALEQGDQAQFQSIKDPTTGAPFTYTQTDDGFQLSSSLPSINDPTVNETETSFNPGRNPKTVIQKITNKKVGGQTVTLAFPLAPPGNQ
jgi:hypothetical protein